MSPLQPEPGQNGPAGPGDVARRASLCVLCQRPAAVGLLFQNVVRDLGAPTLVVHNIDGRVPGIFGKAITDAEPAMAFETLRNSAFSAFLVGQQAARLMRENKPNARGAKGTIIFTNASASLKGFAKSGAFAMACHAKSGLAESMARELMPQGIHVANVPSTPRSAGRRRRQPRARRPDDGDDTGRPDCIAENTCRSSPASFDMGVEVACGPWPRNGDGMKDLSSSDMDGRRRTDRRHARTGAAGRE